MAAASSVVLLSAACLLLLATPSLSSFALADGCDIFCHGPLLEAVQLSGIFNDSKHFVDMSLRYSPSTTLEAFLRMPNKSDTAMLKKFIGEFFDEPGSELEPCDPTDWQPRPEGFKVIRDPYYRLWAHMINQKWFKLCRKVKKNVLENPNRHSLIVVPKPFIVPGGRFLEFYYWDAYWIIKGLLASEMYSTAKDMIINLAVMVERYGFIPNGGRIYYLNRSQPPLLTSCVYDYFNMTGDIDLLQGMLPVLEKEYEFWVRERTVPYGFIKGEPIRLFQYRTKVDQPRSEAYKEDLAVTAHLPDLYRKRQVWSNIAAACESGWDFTSRWFGHSGPHRSTMRSIRTSRIAPVDLNAFLCGNYFMLSKLYRAAGNPSAARKHEQSYEAAKKIMYKIFWDPIDQIWYDIDLDTGMRVSTYYASNMVPLFTRCFENEPFIEEAVVRYLEDNDILNMPHGLPTSLTWTDEQWDRPNGWAPMNHMIIEGLRRSQNPVVQEAAYDLAKKWLELNFGVFLRSGGKMFEKYNVENGYAAGGGGEYDVQEGFGWTNGVALDLLLTYGHRLTVPIVPSQFQSGFL
uniref:Trehalase n=1 Tax=Trichuris muris TaxID=70415 RepID=A0A5S6QXL3_TRIMR